MESQLMWIIMNIVGIKRIYVLSIIGLILLLLIISIISASYTFEFDPSDNQKVFSTVPDIDQISSENDIYTNQNIVLIDYSEDQSCSECHEDFKPFEVELSQPKKVEPEKSFDYEIKVINSDDKTPHDVEDLEAILTGISETPKEPYHDTVEDSIRRYQVKRHTFPVEETASSLNIVLTGNNGFIGLNNIDLILRSPNGAEWSSKSGGTDEEINLDEMALRESGLGNYIIEIQYIRGTGQISYSVTIDVSYYPTDLIKIGNDLNPDDSYTFTWTLSLTSEELENLGTKISGTVRYDHGGENPVTYRYTVEIIAGVIQNPGVETQFNFLLENGRIIGLVSLLILGFIMIIGFSSGVRQTFAKSLKVKNPQNIHCWISIIIILFGIIHASLLISGPYSWNSSPSIYGTTAIIIFGTMAFTSFYRNPIISKIGNKKWKRLHLILSIIAVLIILYHAFTFGGHFT
jgi:hypothetical protein